MINQPADIASILAADAVISGLVLMSYVRLPEYAHCTMTFGTSCMFIAKKRLFIKDCDLYVEKGQTFVINYNRFYNFVVEGFVING